MAVQAVNQSNRVGGRICPSELRELREVWLEIKSRTGNEPCETSLKAIDELIQILAVLGSILPPEEWLDCGLRLLATSSGQPKERYRKLVEDFWQFVCLSSGVSGRVVQPSANENGPPKSPQTNSDPFDQGNDMPDVPNPEIRAKLLDIWTKMEHYTRRVGGSISQSVKDVSLAFIDYASGFPNPDISALETFVWHHSQAKDIAVDELQDSFELFAERVEESGVLPPPSGQKDLPERQRCLKMSTESFIKEYKEKDSLREKVSLLGAFNAWCESLGIRYLNVSKADVSAYIYFLKHEKLVTSGPNKGSIGCKPQTVENHRRVLHCFFNWCINKGWISENPVAHIERSKHTANSRRKNPFTRPELKRLYETFDVSTFKGLRNKTIASYFYDTGRCSEIPEARMAGLDLEEGWLQVDTKLHKTRTVRLSKRTVALLREYLPERDKHLKDLLARRRKEGNHEAVKAIQRVLRSGYIFVSDTQGTPLGRSGAARAIREAATKAGFKIGKFKPINFRRAAASHHLDHGGNYDELQRILGHEDAKTTKRYSGGWYPVGDLPNDWII